MAWRFEYGAALGNLVDRVKVVTPFIIPLCLFMNLYPRAPILNHDLPATSQAKVGETVKFN